MRHLLLAAPLLLPACAPEEEPEERATWVQATIGGVPYESPNGLALLYVYWSPNHIQMFSGQNLNAVVFGWEGGDFQRWILQPITGEGISGLFWTDESNHQWMSVAGSFEITSFEHNPLYGGADRRIGWAEGSFEAVLEDIDPYESHTLDVTDGDYRVVLRHGAGQ